jgi:UPF0755 protein
MFLRVKNKIYSRLLALVILLIVTSWILVSKDMLAKNSEVFQVESGSSISDVAKELSDKKLIKSRLFFKSLSKFIGANKKLKSGYYQISPNMSIIAFLDNISNGSVLTTKVTLIEGKTIKYYFEQLSLDPTLESKGSLEDVMQSIGVKAPYDGWFFPETYNFNYGESVENVLRRSYNEMQQKVSDLWINRDKSLPLKSQYDAIILASLIENETALDNEKTLISGVFIRRINEGMRLQTDPTVIYALGDTYTPPLKKADLKIDSLYNTYRNKGLPPGAISSVSYQSLYAALHPEKGNDLYFVSKKDGSHAFAPSYKEHKENIKKYLNNN